jgi:hypothetical protein
MERLEPMPLPHTMKALVVNESKNSKRQSVPNQFARGIRY